MAKKVVRPALGVTKQGGVNNSNLPSISGP